MQTTTSMPRIFSALGDETRLGILARLTDGEKPLAELAEPYSMSQTAVSRHVRVLEEAGMVRVEKRGRTRYCRLLGEPMRQARDWLSGYERFWSDNLDALDAYLASEDDGLK